MNFTNFILVFLCSPLLKYYTQHWKYHSIVKSSVNLTTTTTTAPNLSGPPLPYKQRTTTQIFYLLVNANRVNKNY